MDGLAKPGIIVVCGPTATGKSALALALCRGLGGEIVSADSMQVYKGLVVGTAALTKEELGGVAQHMAGFLPPQEAYSVAAYVQGAAAAIKDICARGAVPLVCGGTGLYINSLLNGLRFAEADDGGKTREALEARWNRQGPQAMLARLAEEDPACAARLAPADKKRILRALELYSLTGKTAEERERESRPKARPYRALVLGLNYSSREMLYQAIDQRVNAMLAAGLEQEARQVYLNRAVYKTAAQAIGYKELFPYFAGEASLEACAEELKKATRNYAKRQLTWFRKLEGIHWLNAEDEALVETAKRLAADWKRE